MNKLILDFAGVSSTGKTTVADYVEKELHNRKVRVFNSHSVSRFLGENGINISEKSEVFTQSYISLINWVAIFHNISRYDVVLTTDLGVRSTAYLLGIKVRSVVDKLLFDKLLRSQFDFLNILKEINKSSTKILHFYVPVEFPLIKDGIRCNDIDYQNDIDLHIKDIYKAADIKYITLSGSVEQRGQKVLEAIGEYI